MQSKSVWLTILIAGVSAIGWGICIAIGFWLARKFICDPIDRKMDQLRGEHIANEVLKDCKF